MNKKLIPLLLALPLLGGCSNVSKPNFKKVGEKVTIEKFMEEMTKASEKNIFTKNYEEGQYKPSFKASLSSKGYSEEITKRAKKEIGSEKLSSSSKIDFSLDTKNGASKSKETGKVTTSLKTKNATVSVSEKSSATFIVQKVVDGGDEYAATVNTKDKTYKIYTMSGKVSENQPYEELLDYSSDAVFEDAVDYFEDLILDYYDETTEEGKARYSFYQNKSIFTVEYKFDETNEEYKISKQVSIKVQADLTKETSITYAYYMEETTKSEALEDDMSTLKGDVVEKTKKSSLTVKASKSNVTVKPVKLDGYSKYVYKY